MATTRSISRSVPRLLLTRSFASSAPLSKTPAAPSLLSRSRPLAAAAALSSVLRGGFVSAKGLSSASSLNDPNPNWSNRPPKETILLDGCDFEHWLVVVEPPQSDLTRDEIVDGYVKTLARIVGSEEEARMKIYSVSHRCYFAFGALVSEDLSHKLKELPNVRWVLPDSYLDVRNKDYGGEPFIDGRAVPYDPKYHEEWMRNNDKANYKNKRPNRPRNPDNSRDFVRRRENMAGNSPPPQNYGGAPPQNNMGGQRPPANYGGSPPQNYGGAPPPPNYGGAPPQNNMGGAPLQNNMGGQRPPANYGGGPPQNNMGGAPPPNYGGAPPQSNMGGAPPQNNMGGQRPPANYGGVPPQNYGGAPPPNYAQPQNSMGGQRPPADYGGGPSPNYGGAPPPQTHMGGAPPQNNMGVGPPNAGWSGNNNYQQQSGGMQQPQYQTNNYPPIRDGGGNPYQR